MVDRNARRQLALMMRRYASGRISEQQLIEGMPEGGDGDAAVEAAYHFACELPETYVRPSELPQSDSSHVTRRDVARWVLFLMTDEEYLWPTKSLHDALFRWWLVLSFVVWAGFTAWLCLLEGFDWMIPLMGLIVAAFLVVMPGAIVLKFREVFIEPRLEARWKRRTGADSAYWPFLNAEQYARVAARHPFALPAIKGSRR